MRASHLTTLATGVGHWILGAIWYGLFQQPFGRALTAYIGPNGIGDLERRSEAAAFGCALIASIATVYLVRGALRGSTPAKPVSISAGLAALAFLVQLPTVLFEGRPMSLFLISAGYAASGVVFATMVLGRVSRVNAR